GIRDGHVTGVQTCALPILIIATAFLMVSTWRFASFKGIDLHSPHPFRIIIFIAGIIALIWFFSRPTLLFLALTYMLSGVLARLRSEEHTSELQSRGHLVCR